MKLHLSKNKKEFIFSFLLFCLATSPSLAKQHKPKPSIKVNSANYSISVNQKNTISVSISMKSGDNKKKQADWWLAASTPNGWFYYQSTDNKWIYSGLEKSSIKPSFQGPLVSFETTTIDDFVGLPKGKYKLYFGVDLIMDGQIQEEELYEDSVFLNISEESDTIVAGGATIIDIAEENGEIELTLSALEDINLEKANIQIYERLVETGEEVLVKKNAKAKNTIQNQPIKLAMVLDRSGSFNKNEEDLMNNGVLKMLEFLRRGDQVEVINIATDIYVDASFRNYNASPITNAILNPSITSGWTRVYDGIIQGIEDAVSHSTNVKNQNAVLVITDGEDNRSENTLGDVINTSQVNNTPIFIVGLADESDPGDLDVKGLTELAEKTGGRFVETFSPDIFTDILERLALSLTNIYKVSYNSAFSEDRTIILRIEVDGKIYAYEKQYSL